MPQIQSKIKFTIVLILLFIQTIGYTQRVSTPPPPTDSLLIYEKDKTFDFGSEVTQINRSGRKSVKRISQPKLLVYLPSHKISGKAPAIIICPGGGYAQLMIDDEGAAIARKLNKAGIVCFVFKYSTSVKGSLKNPKLPLLELQQAITQVRNSYNKWQIDTNKVGLMGFSAGGHLAALGSVKAKLPQIPSNTNTRPNFSILIYPIISFMDSLTSNRSKTRINLLGQQPTASEKIWFSPELQVTPTTPPTFIVHAENDSTALVQNSLVYLQQLIKHNIPAKAIIYEKGGHGFGIINQAENESWYQDLIKWLQLNHFLPQKL